mgnify:CR=1 FL=1
MGDPIIETNGLTKIYDNVHTAVNQLSLTIYRGEVFGLLGPNGAGKSTTIRMLLGLTEPTSGTVRVCGLDPTRDPLSVKRRVGYLPDDVGFYEDMTGKENLIYTARLNRIPPDEAEARADEVLRRVGLEHAADKRVGAYSRGMRQRLGLADVLIKRPEVAILDEPTLGIDPEGIREFLDLIRSLSRDEKMTVLLSSHQLYQVQQICDRVGLFVQGRLLAVGDIHGLAAELFADTPMSVEVEAEPVTDALLERLRGIDGVVSVEANGSLLEVGCQRDASADIAAAVVGAGASLRRLSAKTYGLDEIYHRYFEGRDSDAASPSGFAPSARPAVRRPS